MKIGIVGYQGSGKSSLFAWLTGETPDPSLAHATQSAMAPIPDPRIEQLCELYHPKKVTRAALEVVDTPGLSRDHSGSAGKLAMIREAGCLVLVVSAFDSDARSDLTNFQDDLLIADLDIVSGRVQRLRDAVRKPRPNQDEQKKELAALEPLLAALEEGRSLHSLELTPEQQKAIRSFQLFSEKPRLVVINTADDVGVSEDYTPLAEPDVPLVAFSIALELELQGMEPADRAAFCEEMGVRAFDRDALLRSLLDVSGQMIFFTAGEKEVRTWLLRQGGTALEAADGIHTDLARGFIRAETMSCDDLFSLGSEREVKAQNRLRKEHKDYVIQDGDIINIQHN